jgi:hypothetical protein
MKLDLFDIDKFVAQNDCPQVRNPVFFNYDKTPTETGLFSYELFGVTDRERRSIFGYIDLNGNYIHPLIFSMMGTRMGAMKDLLTGNRYAVVEDGKILTVPDDYEGAGTGIKFLYDNFEKINWADELDEEEIDSIDKTTRLKFLKIMKKNEFFVNKWLVIPPHYRAESTDAGSMGEAINEMYKDLISKTNSMKQGYSIQIFGEKTQLAIQNLLVDIFNETIRPIKGKGSMLRKHLLGKTVDFTASNVITSPPISGSNSPADMPVKFGYGAYPLATVLSLFQPFFIKYTVDFLTEMLTSFSEVFYDDIKTVNYNQFNTDYAEKLLKLFVKSEDERFKPISIEYTNTQGKKVEKIVEIEDSSNKDGPFIKRPMTYTDLYFWIAKDIITDKHVYVTRHPVTNFQNIYPTKIKMMTTAKTREKVFIKIGTDLLEFENYPMIKFEGDSKPGKKTDYGFINVFVPGNIYLKAIGGDYDGDMLYMRGLFTKEANDEAEKLIYAKSNLLDASGGPSRGISKIGKEAVVTLYELTKEGK